MVGAREEQDEQEQEDQEDQEDQEQEEGGIKRWLSSGELLGNGQVSSEQHLYWLENIAPPSKGFN